MLIYKRLKRLANENDVILDVGTKNGKHVDSILGEVVGIDLEFKFPLNPEISSYMYADGRRLPFKTNSFDYVVINQVLEHVDNRGPLITEVARVLKPDGIALFSFPNRFSLNRPHGLPRWLSFVPKSIGERIASVLLTSEKSKYYTTSVFPLSPIGARQLLSTSFTQVDYITVDESIESPDVYGNSLAARLFVFCLPLIQRMAVLSPFIWLFEETWSYVGYECTNASI